MPELRALRALAVLALLWLACGRAEPPSRVLLLGFDGLDPSTVDLLMSEGQMPNFARLRQGGAYGRLRSQEPLLSPILWTTIATGKGADEHGIGHFVAVQGETGEVLPVTSAMRRVRALWNIASDAGKTVAVVGWWATWPPEEILGAVVSDHTAYHFLFEEGLRGGDEGAVTTHPPDLLDRLRPWLKEPSELGYEEAARFISVDRQSFDEAVGFDDELAHFKWALASAESYRDVGLHLWHQDRPELAMIYIEGTDSTSHLFGHLFRAEGLAGELAEQQRRFGNAVEEVYRLADRVLGDYLEAMDDRTTLIVLSDHGFELGALHDDPSRTRDLRRVSERFHTPHGILYLYGHRIRAYRRLNRPGLLDIAPTVLALMGLPPAEDMPGRVLDEAFSDTALPERIASYERASAPLTSPPRDPAVDEAVRRRLASLGYLDTHSPQGDRNLAGLHFEAGRFREAVELYRRLAAEAPGDPALRTSLAGALGALGRYDEALVELEAALALDPLHVEALHNRAVVSERRGEVELAIGDYREVVRYFPAYEPSRQALVRLTGGAGVRRPASDAERRAGRLAELASQAARRGAYGEASKLLDEAAEIAPDYALVYQYRSNVAYFRGDFAAAAAALERALELEPDNLLFQENLRRLLEGSGASAPGVE